MCSLYIFSLNIFLNLLLLLRKISPKQSGLFDVLNAQIGSAFQHP